MVHLLLDPANPHHGSTHDLSAHPSSHNGVMSREEHAQKARDLLAKKHMAKTPRRGWSMTESPAEELNDQATPLPQPNTRKHSVFAPSRSSQVYSFTIINPEKPQKEEHGPGPRRPKLPPPRRSYSVMDYEPLPPNTPRPSHKFGLLDLPSELVYSVFDFLDPIDSACLGLVHPSLYSIHRRKNGTVRLDSRYSGPNNMEWAWRGAGPLLRQGPTSQAESEVQRLRIKGQVYCRKCGTERCELHRHLKDWIGPGFDYCRVKDKFCTTPDDSPSAWCYMPSPKNPNRCGRHRDPRPSPLERAFTS